MSDYPTAWAYSPPEPVQFRNRILDENGTVETQRYDHMAADWVPVPGARAASSSPAASSAREGWMDAAHHAYRAWENLRDATTLSLQADALTDLSNAMGDLVSWLPEWDWEHGVLNDVPEEAGDGEDGDAA